MLDAHGYSLILDLGYVLVVGIGVSAWDNRHAMQQTERHDLDGIHAPEMSVEWGWLLALAHEQHRGDGLLLDCDESFPLVNERA